MIILPAKVNMWGTEVKGTDFYVSLGFVPLKYAKYGISMQQNITCNCKT